MISSSFAYIKSDSGDQPMFVASESTQRVGPIAWPPFAEEPSPHPFPREFSLRFQFAATARRINAGMEREPVFRMIAAR
jgi:hypothetical protein